MGSLTNLAAAKREAIYYDNYVNYLNSLDDRQPNIGQGQDKPPQVEVLFKPFGLTLTATQHLAANATAERWTAYNAAVGARAKAIPGGTDVILPIKSFKPARIVIKTGVGAKRVETSKRTGRKYVTRGGTSGSIPFGQDGAESELEAFDAIKTAIQNQAGFNADTTKISRVKEKI